MIATTLEPFTREGFESLEFMLQQVRAKHDFEIGYVERPAR